MLLENPQQAINYDKKQSIMKHFIYTFIVLIIAVSCAAQEQRNLLLDFNKIIDSTNYLLFYTKNEVVAEAITAEGRKSITIFNLYLPKNTNFNALNKRTTDQLCTFFVLPTNKKQDVTWNF